MSSRGGGGGGNTSPRAGTQSGAQLLSEQQTVVIVSISKGQNGDQYIWMDEGKGLQLRFSKKEALLLPGTLLTLP